MDIKIRFKIEVDKRIRSLFTDYLNKNKKFLRLIKGDALISINDVSENVYSIRHRDNRGSFAFKGKLGRNGTSISGDNGYLPQLSFDIAKIIIASLSSAKNHYKSHPPEDDNNLFS